MPFVRERIYLEGSGPGGIMDGVVAFSIGDLGLIPLFLSLTANGHLWIKFEHDS